jgi:hypothetical protein
MPPELMLYGTIELLHLASERTGPLFGLRNALTKIESFSRSSKHCRLSPETFKLAIVITPIHSQPFF